MILNLIVIFIKLLKWWEHIMNTVYIDIRHMNFWYGHYNFCGKSCNDEVIIYSDESAKESLGYFEITTKLALENSLKNDLDKEEDKEDYTERESFLESNSDIYYSFKYPRDKRDIRDQVKHDAPRNEKNHKPIYIDMWTKLSESLDLNEIKVCVKIIIKEFFNTDVTTVEIIDIPSYEEVKLDFEEDWIPVMYPMSEIEFKLNRLKRSKRILEELIGSIENLIQSTRHSRLKQKHMQNLKNINDKLFKTKELYLKLLKNETQN